MDLPLKQNLNWVALAAAIAGVFAWFFPGIPEVVRSDILTIAFAGVVLAVPLIHTFINHPANQAAAMTLLQSASSAVGKTSRNSNVRSVAMLLLLIGIVAPGLTACASNPLAAPASAATQTDPLQNLANFSIVDLQAADADAVANNDTIAHACYPALVKFIQSFPNLQLGTVSGAFGAFQKGRDVRNTATAGIPDYVTMGCGPLYAQVHADLLTWLAGNFVVSAAKIATP